MSVSGVEGRKEYFKNTMENNVYTYVNSYTSTVNKIILDSKYHVPGIKEIDTPGSWIVTDHESSIGYLETIYLLTYLLKTPVNKKDVLNYDVVSVII